MKWAIRAYEYRRQHRYEIFQGTQPNIPIIVERLIQPIYESVQYFSQLKQDMCDFIVEIRKENGEQYPGNSMYDLVSGISLYLKREHRFNTKLLPGHPHTEYIMRLRPRLRERLMKSRV